MGEREDEREGGGEECRREERERESGTCVHAPVGSPVARVLALPHPRSPPAVQTSSAAQILQLSRPPSLPPIYEMARPELKLAGMRIDPELFARSKMSYHLDMAIVDAQQVGFVEHPWPGML
eukprot:237969-Chlamydomonas_euryale.AAC.5